MNEFSFSEQHMGTEVSLSFVCEHRELATTIAKKTFSTIHTYEKRFSRFLPESELSLLNQYGTAIVSDEFITILRRCLDLIALTRGAFNPLAQVSTLGYQASYEQLPNTVSGTTLVQYSVDPRLIVIDDSARRVSLGSDQRLDFGGILKGYLAALLADEIMQTHTACTGCIINIGGDIATRGLDAFHQPFIFLLYNPITDTETPIRVTDASLATSGTYARTWETASGVQHHIIDSTSYKNPTLNIITTSIVTSDGAVAEALAKLFLIRGVTNAIQIVPPEQYHYAYFSVSTDGDVTSTLQ